MILRAKQAGLSLDTVRALCGAQGAGARRAVLETEAKALRSVIESARVSLTLVDCALGCDHDEITECAHFQRATSVR